MKPIIPSGQPPPYPSCPPIFLKLRNGRTLLLLTRVSSGKLTATCHECNKHLALAVMMPCVFVCKREIEMGILLSKSVNRRPTVKRGRDKSVAQCPNNGLCQPRCRERWMDGRRIMDNGKRCYAHIHTKLPLFCQNPHKQA